MTKFNNLINLIIICILNSLSLEVKAQANFHDIITKKMENPSNGYLIASFTVEDSVTFQKYRDASSGLAQKYHGKMIMRDPKAKMVEGSGQQIIAVMEFPSITELEQFYNSPEYTAARQFRISSSQGTVVLGTGISENISTK